MSTANETKKKFGIGKLIGIILLALIVCGGGYGYFWFTGLSAMPDEIKNAKTNATPELVSFYEQNILQNSGAPILLDIEQSKYVFSRLFNETNFFHLAAGSPVKISSFYMYPSGNNMRLAMTAGLSGGKSNLMAAFEDIVLGTKTAYAAEPFAFLEGKQYAITATLSLKTLPDGIGMKPIAVSVGNSPMDVGIAMGIAKQYAPAMQVTADGYIVLGPMQIVDSKTNKAIGTLSGLEVKDGKSYVTLK